MRELLRSPTLQSVIVHGAAGAGFAGANLILARVLPEVEYGLFTLVTALMNLAFSLAPLGLDSVALRRELSVGPRLLGRVLLSAALVALAFVLIGCIGYPELDAPLLALLGISTVAGGALVVASAQFQSQQRFGLSLALIQSPNLILLLAALVVVAVGGQAAGLPLALSSAGLVLAGLFGWQRLFRERSGSEQATAPAWGEAFALAGLSASGLVLVQLDRLMIPHVLPLRELATYGVLAAIAGSLFRVLQMGVAYSLAPRLRAAPDVRTRRRLIAHEAQVASAIVVIGSVVIWLMTPLVERWFLAGRYHLPGALVLAAIAAGIAKIMSAFTRSTLTALGDARELQIMNLLGSLAVAIAVVASIAGARFGLAGVIYGVGLGWLVRALGGLWFTLRHLRLPVPVPLPGA